MNHLSIDIETFSSVDIKKSGLYKYAMSPDFEIMLLAFAWDHQPVYLVDLKTAPDPFQLAVIRQALQDPNVIKHARNAAFEWFCLNRAGYYTPIEQWRCDQAHALYCGYPAGLGPCGDALGLAQDKKKLGTGMALIRTFCIPQKPTKSNGNRTRTLPHHEPEKWELFKQYCVQDVVTEREQESRFEPWPLPEREQKLWEIDCLMNTYGVKADRQLVEGALSCASQVERDLLDEAMAISGLSNPKSVAQLTEWLNKEIAEDLDEDLDNLRKDTVQELLDQGVASKWAARMLEIRQQISKTSTKKYDAMLAGMCEDDRIRGLMQHYGANRTGRWAGRLVQVQNLPRNYLKTLKFARELVCSRNADMVQMMYGNVPDTLSQLVRTAFIPEPGCFFLVADFSAIEARVVAWLAGEQWVMDVFASHGKIYEATAAQMFNVPIEKISKGNPEYELRQRGKVAVLGLGYGMGAPRLKEMAEVQYNVIFTEAEAREIVEKWRAANTCITKLWRDLNVAAVAAVETYEPRYGPHGLVFARETSGAMDYMTIQLPTGRKLFYPQPQVRPGNFDRPSLYYTGVDQNSKKWGRISTFGGKITENVVQAIARDCLAEVLLKLAATGYNTVFHVHDEVIIECPRDDLAAVLAIMAEPIPWAPGLLLKGDGFTTAEYYKKE